MASNPSAGMCGLFSRDDLAKAQYRALRLFVGRGREWSFKDLANAAKLDLQRLHDIAERPDSPEWRPWSDNEKLSLATVLGDGLLSEFMRLAGFGAFRLPDPENDRPLREMVPDLTEDAAALARADARGGADVIDIRSIGSRMVNRGQKLVAMAGRGQGDLFARRA